MAKHKPTSDTEPNMDQSDVQDIFTNNIYVQPTAVDFCITLSQLSQLPSDNPNRPAEIENQIIARIHLTPHHAKIVTAVLVQSILNFERQFGELGIQQPQADLWNTLVRSPMHPTQSK